jgi:hypothetical protein
MGLFDIMLTISDSPSVDCVGYRIEKVGRRSHIFVNNDNPTRTFTRWCRYYRHQRSELLSGSSLQIVNDDPDSENSMRPRFFSMFTLRKKFQVLFTWPICETA